MRIMTLRLHALITGAAFSLLTFCMGALTFPGAAQADGIAKPWQMNFQDAASPVMEMIHDFHELLFWIITLITLFVLALLIYVIFKFNEKANPVPSKTTHNTFIEVVWTVVPIIILVVVIVTDDPPYQGDVDDAHPSTDTSGWYDAVIAAKGGDVESIVMIGFIPTADNLSCTFASSPNLIDFVGQFAPHLVN